LFLALLPAQAAPPGVVLAHSPAKSRQYIGSPGLAILPSGEYVASHDLFGPGSTKDQTHVYASTDRGKTWAKRAEIKGQWWSSLFVHKGDLYLLGTSREYGHCIIRRSRDAGKTWSTPRDRNSGLLLADGKYHCAPVPMVVHRGRLWRAMEDAQGPGGWGSHFRAFVLSAPVDADLLRADSWTFSNRLGRDPSWLGGKFGGWLEGNVVVTPEGRLVNILRADYRAVPEKAAVLSISEDGKTITFDARTGFIDFPGGCKKFTIRHDAASKCYWALSNDVLDRDKKENIERVRNTLTLLRSDDLRTWTRRGVIVSHPDTRRHGYQYADWLIDGDDLVILVRTAHDDAHGGAHNCHDANYLTFHRVKEFRKMKK
jgi:hypothetical protein